MRSRPQPKLSGMFTAPCGAWVAPYRMRSGAVWFAPVPATRSRVLGRFK